MHVTNGEVWQAREALQQVLQERWPVKTAYALMKLAQAITAQHAIVEAVRVKLIQQYGATNAHGQIAITPDSENWAPFAAAFNELMAQEANIDREKVALPEREDVSLTPKDLLALAPFVELA